MRKVLIVSSNFYPDPYVGAIRATQWAKLLSEHGWHVVVACRNYGHQASREDLDAHVHPTVEVIYLNPASRPDSQRKKPGLKARTRAKLAEMLGKYVFVPAPSILFWNNVRQRLVQLVTDIQPDVVITTAPPNSVHAVGFWLKEAFPALPWLADFRDAFRRHGRYRVTWLESYHSARSFQFEKSVYRIADRITCAIPTHQRWIRKRFPLDFYKTSIIFNGPPEEICKTPIENSIKTTNHTSVKIIGYSDAPESITLAKTVAALRRNGMDIGLRFVGRLPSVKPAIESALGSAVVFTGPVNHNRAIQETLTAGLLVAVLGKYRSHVFGISSKLFEYLSVPVPVIVINPTRPDRRLFSGVAGLIMLHTPSEAELEAAFTAALSIPSSELQLRAQTVREKWSRRSQVAQLASILDDLVKERDARTQTPMSAPA